MTSDSQRSLWELGDYSAVARHLLPISVAALDALDVSAGDRLLDVGVGDGNTAIDAARRGAVVIGIDLTPRQIELAGARAAAEGVTVALEVGNAEALPYPDGAFDLVVSVLGAVFAPDRRRAAAELARVCRPGGRVAVVSWARRGRWPEAWAGRAAQLVPALGETFATDPWSEPGSMAELLGAVGLDVRVETRPFDWSFPSAEAACDLFMQTMGGFIALDRQLEAGGRPGAVAAAVREAMDDAGEAGEVSAGFRMSSPYLLAVAHRGS